jgi:hypothetical protein
MALTTYAGLQASIADFLERSDLTATIPDFITLFEARANAELDLRTMESEASLVGVPGSRFIALPAGYREITALWVTVSTDRQPVRIVVPEELVTTTTQGQPYFATVDGSNLAFERPCDQAYAFTLRMLGSLALSSVVTTNLLLQNYPNAYLFGALVEAAPYLRDADLLALYSQKLADAMASVKAKEGRAKALAPLRTEISANMLGQRASFDIRSGQ